MDFNDLNKSLVMFCFDRLSRRFTRSHLSLPPFLPPSPLACSHFPRPFRLLARSCFFVPPRSVAPSPPASLARARRIPGSCCKPVGAIYLAFPQNQLGGMIIVENTVCSLLSAWTSMKHELLTAELLASGS